jgi:hypothetical protein
MTSPNPYVRPSITVHAFDTLHGAPFQTPVAVVEVDDLPTSYRLNPLQPLNTDVDGWATPAAFETYMGPWTPCTPGLPIVVEAAASQVGTVYISSSADGITEADLVAPGNVSVDEPHGVRFVTTLPYYRVGVAPSALCKVRIRSQQRTT